MKSVIDAMRKMGDHSISVDIISIMVERSGIFTQNICIVVLPLLPQLLQSEINWHLTIAMKTMLVPGKTFGDVT